ncbi:MAG: gas vesicle structural protein GvpA [Sphaerobacter thermophilus]|nr:MAG: hypothetical protein DIU58_11715 [Sphaerobacter thermophilus]
MTVPRNAVAPAQRGRPVQRTSSSSSLADVLNVILDKGIVIDAWARVSVVGIEILTIEARVVVASIDTYLRYAEAIGLTALAAAPAEHGAQWQQNGRGPGGERPSEDEVYAFVAEHRGGVRLGELEAYFDVSRQELEDIVDRLTEENRLQRDEERRLYYVAEESQIEAGGSD